LYKAADGESNNGVQSKPPEDRKKYGARISNLEVQIQQLEQPVSDAARRRSL
jgi:hypothetical protein